MLQDCCGTPAYMAPEVLFENEYSNKADVYSYSMVLYQLITGDCRIYNCDLRELRKKLNKEKGLKLGMAKLLLHLKTWLKHAGVRIQMIVLHSFKLSKSSSIIKTSSSIWHSSMKKRLKSTLKMQFKGWTSPLLKNNKNIDFTLVYIYISLIIFLRFILNLQIWKFAFWVYYLTLPGHLC